MKDNGFSLSDFINRIKSSSAAKNSGIIIVGAIALIILYIVFFGTAKEPDTTESSFDSELYRKAFEARLESILSGIDGVGRCRVMVTLSDTGKKLYAKEESTTANSSSDGEKLTESEKQDTSYITVRNGGNEIPLELSSALPEIAGIAVVCSGGGNSAVKLEITLFIQALTGLSGHNIHISKMKN